MKSQINVNKKRFIITTKQCENVKTVFSLLPCKDPCQGKRL